MANSIPLLKRMVWYAVQLGVAFYGLTMIGYLLARLLTNETWPWIRFTNNFVPWWTLGAVIAIVIALFSRQRVVLVALQLPIVIMFLIWYGDLLWVPPTPPARAHDKAELADTVELTVAAFNIHSRTSDPDQIVDALAALNADIIGLEELNSRHAAVIFGALEEDYPYHYHFRMASYNGYEVNVGILSRYPILAEEQYTDRTWGRNLRVLVDVEGVTVSVYLEHPDSPRNAFSPFKYDPDLHNVSMNRLVDEIKAEQRPVLVLCDCNMTDQTAAYRQMSDLLNDSFREVGWGLGFTFPAKPVLLGRLAMPLLRIDYIWHSDHFTAVEAHVAADNGTSDHFPVVATLRLHKDKVTG